MKYFLLSLLLLSPIYAADPPLESVQSILDKYKDIKEEIKDLKAVVKTDDAVIYADVGLEYPVHTLRKGQSLKLANFEVKTENVFPILINGGVGYIRGGDISIQKRFSNESASKLNDHNIDYQFEEFVTKLDGRTNLLVKIDSFSPGPNWSDFNELVGDTNQGIKAYQFLVEFHPRNEKFAFGVGTGFYSSKQAIININTWLFEGQISYSPIKWDAFQWDFQLGAGFSSGINIEIAGIEGINKGYLYSWNIGTSIRILPESKIGAILGVNYKSWNISGMKEVLLPNSLLVDLNGFAGVDLFFGLSYKF
jgi:hypothetical protein